MKKFEKELLFSQVEDETTSNGNGSTGENAGEGENDAPEQEPVDEGAEADNNMYDGQDGTSSGQTPDGQGNSSSEQTQDGQNSSSSGQNPEGQGADSGYDLEEDIPSVTIIGYPPEDNDEPEEPIEESNDDGEEYEDNNENEDDTQSSTEQSEEDETSTEQQSTNERIVVEDGYCVLGTIASIVQKALNISAEQALQLAYNKMVLNGINPNPPILGNPGINIPQNQMLKLLNSINGINAFEIPLHPFDALQNDQNIRLFFNDNKKNDAIINIGVDLGDNVGFHMMLVEDYLGNLNFVVYDSVEGKSKIFRYEQDYIYMYGIQYTN